MRQICPNTADNLTGLAHGRFLHEYRKGAVNGASPLKLIVMLYDGGLRFMESAKCAMERGELEVQNAELQRAQRILTELMSCLDMEQGGEIAKNLLAIYSYVYNELIQANVEDDINALLRCIAVMSELRASWADLEENLGALKTQHAA